MNNYLVVETRRLPLEEANLIVKHVCPKCKGSLKSEKLFDEALKGEVMYEVCEHDKTAYSGASLLHG